MLSENVLTNVALFMKMIVLRFFHPQQLLPPSQDHLKDKVKSRPWEHVNSKEGDVPCLFTAWQHHPAAIFLSDCLSQCLWMLLGKKGHLFRRMQLEGWGKGVGEGAVKNIPIPACCRIQLFWQEEAEKAFPAVALAFMGYCSLAGNCSPLDRSTGSQSLQLLTLDQIWG